ncbi:MAG: hypothetical protein JXB49_03245 [Bacteroidales bacterium]|nr:hypothetical protein [Bacteroidales bacterium]
MVRLSVLMLYILSLFSLYGQEKQWLFANIDKESGLPNNYTVSFLRDSKGFLWVGTIEGLGRWDGYSFKLFKNISEDTTSLHDNIINGLYEDYDGKIWIAAGNYIDIYDPENESITHAYQLFNGKLTYPYESKWMLLKAKNGNYWYSNTSQGLYMYIPTNDSLIRVLEGYETYLPENSLRITSIGEDSKGNIWSVDNKGSLKRIDPRTLKASEVFKIKTTFDNFYRMYVDNDDDIWIYDKSNASGVMYINPEKEIYKQYSTTNNICKLNNDYITGIVQDEDGNIWVGTDHGGINLIKKDTWNIQYIKNNPLNNRSLCQDVITAIYKDYDGFIWIGSFKQGFGYYHKNLFKFDHYLIKLNNNAKPGYNDIDNFAEDKNGNLWIGTNGGGLIFFNRENNSFKQYINNPNDPSSLSADIIIGLISDSRDHVWAGTYFGGLNYYDGSRFHHFRANTNNPEAITDDRIWDICEDSDGMLWIATLLGGVNVLNPETGRVTEVHRWDNDTGIRSNVIFSIIEDHSGNMWFATVDGLRMFNKRTRQFTYYYHDPLNPVSLSKDFVYDVFEDSRGWIWVATNDGLSLLNEDYQTFTVFRKNNGLPTNRILTILEDNNDDIWLGTSNGLCNVKIARNNDGEYSFSFISYNESDGLQGNEFNEKSAFRTSHGELLFGGSNGFNFFKPDDIYIKNTESNIVFTDFQIFNKSIQVGDTINNRQILTKSITQTDKIVLLKRENVFSIEFSNLNYFHPERQKYKYKLENFNNTWLETDSKTRKITYTNLNAGEYTFRVKVTNNDGSWSNKEANIKILILPPWYETLYFKIILGIFILGLTTGFYLYRVKRYLKQQKFLEKKVEERTFELSKANLLLTERKNQISRQNEELNQHRNKLELLVESRTTDLEKALKRAEESDKLKTSFLANLSHEIRTPMNAIAGFSSLLKEEKLTADDKEFFSELIDKNIESLLLLINDILDISKIESNQLEIMKRPFNVTLLLEEIYRIYKPRETEDLIIAYIKNPSTEKLYINSDELRIKQVFQNLMDNAIKFTEKGYVHMGYEIIDKTIRFYVKDTGIGILRKDHDKIFKPFTKIEDSKSKIYRGAGLGLSISKSIIKLLDGEIDFFSEINKGTTFYFTLPLDIALSSTK